MLIFVIDVVSQLITLLHLLYMKNLLIILFLPVFLFGDYDYSLEDKNSTSPTSGLDVWNPEYSDFITLHYFSSQG